MKKEERSVLVLCEPFHYGDGRVKVRYSCCCVGKRRGLDRSQASSASGGGVRVLLLLVAVMRRVARCLNKEEAREGEG